MEPIPISENELINAKSTMLREAEARTILSSDLTGIIVETLYKGADSERVERNQNVANELARGAGEILDAISAASINWSTKSEDDDDVTREFDKELVRLMASDGLISGKMALFPRLEDGRLRLEALSGYLHPVFASGNALEIQALIQFLPVTDAQGNSKVQAHLYQEGVIYVYPPADTLTDALKGAPETYPQPHAKGLPVAFKIIRRDANRLPSGLISECVPAFLRFLRTAINRNSVQELAGFPERVVKSDTVLSWLESGHPEHKGLEHPGISEIKKLAPLQMKLIGTGDDYLVTTGADPAPHLLAEEADKQALLDMLRSPDLSGGNLSGVALAERQSKSRSLITDVCSFVAELVTAAFQIASGLPGVSVPEDLIASLTPRFETDRATRIAELATLFQIGALPKSVIYTELQNLGFGGVDDAMIEAAQQSEKTELSVYVPEPA